MSEDGIDHMLGDNLQLFAEIKNIDSIMKENLK